MEREGGGMEREGKGGRERERVILTVTDNPGLLIEHKPTNDPKKTLYISFLLPMQKYLTVRHVHVHAM